MIDPRAESTEPLKGWGPLPLISRKALRRVKHPLPIPTECHYCGGVVELVNNEEIYNGREYGEWPFAYLCVECDAYVGLHPFTDLPLGTLANAELRSARKVEKPYFERLWRNKCSRDHAYAWLANELGIPRHECHWAMFTIAQCRQAGEICRRTKQIPEVVVRKSHCKFPWPWVGGN